MAQFRSAFALAGLVGAMLGAFGKPAPAVAAIDMSGVYVAVEFPCRYTFVQTGTSLEVSGPCTTQNAPLNLTGTIDPDTGAFTVTGDALPACNQAFISGTADGEMFTATYVCDGGSGPVTASKCLNGMLDPGEDCQDGNLADGDCCSSHCRFEPAASACGSDGNVCTDDVCDGASTCTHVPNAAPCDDGDVCTSGDACSAGTCVSGAPQPARACAATEACERTVARALSSCIATVGARMNQCYLRTGAACPATESGTARQLAKTAAKIDAQCSDAAVRALGYGVDTTVVTVTARVQEACTGEVASIAARTFGGPQAALLQGADRSQRQCLSTASSEALRLVKGEARLRAACLAKARGHRATCDAASTMAKIASAEAKTVAAVAAACPQFAATTGLDAGMYVARAGAQARCVTAESHGKTAPLTLDCGPRAAVPPPPRGVWTQVVLDEATYGTRCGDGSPYAFWLRLPPPGKPSEKIAIDLQGGGSCFFESDCDAVAAGLFSATDDGHPSTGLLSSNPAVNPFADWTMVFLPYCTQDAHIGGGVADVFPSITVNRFGALNVRGALRYVRDVLWQDLGDTEPEGYRPDRLTVLFGGESAGGLGVMYNYHYLLDDLRWAHTTAIPDASLALDNGQPLGVAGLGVLAAQDTSPGWGARPFFAPYCQDTTCGIGPHLEAVTSARLKAVPEQQIINISNQVDLPQATTTFFPTTVDWINAARVAFCANQGRTGIRNWLPAVSTPFHTILTDASRWPSVTAGGEMLPMFLAGAIADPDAVTDHVDEGTLVTDYPGVNPIACLEPASASATGE